MSTTGGIIDGVLAVLGAVIGWAGKSRHRPRRDELARRVAANERAIRRLWKDLGALQDSTMKLAVSMWEARSQGRRWHDPP